MGFELILVSKASPGTNPHQISRKKYKGNTKIFSCRGILVPLTPTFKGQLYIQTYVYTPMCLQVCIYCFKQLQNWVKKTFLMF